RDFAPYQNGCNPAPEPARRATVILENDSHTIVLDQGDLRLGLPTMLEIVARMRMQLRARALDQGFHETSSEPAGRTSENPGIGRLHLLVMASLIMNLGLSGLEIKAAHEDIGVELLFQHLVE